MSGAACAGGDSLRCHARGHHRRATHRWIGSRRPRG